MRLIIFFFEYLNRVQVVGTSLLTRFFSEQQEYRCPALSMGLFMALLVDCKDSSGAPEKGW